MREIIYISGGQRSGKSSYAQSMCEQLSDCPIYLATAHCWDDEFKQRIARHKAERGEKWRSIEEEILLSKHNLEGETVMMDCVTLWLTNIFHANDFDLQKSLDQATTEWDRFAAQEFRLVVVSNEIGMGLIPMERSSRAFADLQGWVNQHIAKGADSVYTVISGIPLKLK